MAKKKKFKKNNRKRNFLIQSFILLFLFVGIGYATLQTNLQINGNLTVDGYVSPTLYNVLMLAAREGTYANEYVGNHKDSYLLEPSKSIYYWNAPDSSSGNTLGTEISNKNNVLFAGYCWQMYRTTDTGGVKLIYNGEAESNQCLNTRGNHVGYKNVSSQTLNGSYYYGTDYIYDDNNSVFSLSGTVTTGEVKIGQYTCKSTSSNATCGTLYYVESLSYGSSYNVFDIQNNAHYTSIGSLPYNKSTSTPASLGYMYNSVTSLISKSTFEYVINRAGITNDFYYSDSIEYNTTVSNQYTLIDPQPVSSLSDKNELEGKYIMNGTSNQSAYYVVAGNGNNPYCRFLSNGDLNLSMMLADSYIDNGNGTYTLQNPIEVTYADWFRSTNSVYGGKYLCEGTSATCSDLRHTVSSVNNMYYYYVDVNNWLYKYSEGVSYENGVYTLTGDVQTIWDIQDTDIRSLLNTHHYTCFTNGNTCTTVNFVMFFREVLYYVSLKNGNTIESAVYNMFSSDDVNQYSSYVKTGIDKWYEKNMVSYSNYLEDTTFCSDRSIRSLGTWAPDGTLSGGLVFRSGVTTSLDLSCPQVVDQFSVNNNKALLDYKVGLMTAPEKSLMNNRNILTSGTSYWLLSPESFEPNFGPYMRIVSISGSIAFTSINSSLDIRPVISLKPGTEYSSGTGTKEDPYVIDTN